MRGSHRGGTAVHGRLQRDRESLAGTSLDPEDQACRVDRQSTGHDDHQGCATPAEHDDQHDLPVPGGTEGEHRSRFGSGWSRSTLERRKNASACREHAGTGDRRSVDGDTQTVDARTGRIRQGVGRSQEPRHRRGHRYDAGVSGPGRVSPGVLRASESPSRDHARPARHMGLGLVRDQRRHALGHAASSRRLHPHDRRLDRIDHRDLTCARGHIVDIRGFETRDEAVARRELVD